MEELKKDDALRLATLLVEAAAAPRLTPAASEVEREMRKRCAEFWLGTWHGAAKPYVTRGGERRQADRLVPRQPLLLGNGVVERDGSLFYLQPNVRRIRELPRQLALAGLTDALAAELATPAVLNFHIDPQHRDCGELATCFDVLGGVEAVAADLFAQALSRLDAAVQKDPEGARNEALIMVDSSTEFFGELNMHTGAAFSRLLDLAVSLRTRLLGEGSTSTLLFSQALNLMSQGRADEAIVAAQKACQKKARMGTQSPQYALGLVNLSQIYKLAGKGEAAIQTLQQAVPVLRALPDQEAMLAGCLSNAGELLLNMGHPKEAVPTLEEAQRLMERALGPEHEDVATVLNNLAGAYHATGQVMRAMQLQARVVQIRQFRLGGRHPLVGQAMSNMGAFYLSLGHSAEALPLLQRAVEIARLSDSVEKADDVASALNNLSSAFQTMGRLPEAAKGFEESLSLMRSSPVPNPRHLAQGMQNLAGVLLDMRVLDRAEMLFRESLPLFETHYGPMHPNTGLTVEGIACCLQLKGRVQEAAPWIQRTHRIQAANQG